MRNYWTAILFAIGFILVPAGLFAQSDICSKLPSVDTLRTNPSSGAATNSDIIVQQMRERADMQARQEKERAAWVVQMFPVKNLESAESLKALCIFSAEVVPQPTLHIISVRAPQSTMSVIGDAIKRLDIPQAGPKSVELTVHVLVASDQIETLRPVPASVSPVVDQLKGVLSYKQFYLLETLLGTTADAHNLSLQGGVRGLVPASRPGEIGRETSYTFSAILNIANGDLATASVRLSGLNFYLNIDSQIRISTDVDIPYGKQVVVGKSTSGDRAYILVVSAKILN